MSLEAWIAIGQFVLTMLMGVIWYFFKQDRADIKTAIEHQLSENKLLHKRISELADKGQTDINSIRATINESNTDHHRGLNALERALIDKMTCSNDRILEAIKSISDDNFKFRLEWTEKLITNFKRKSDCVHCSVDS